MSEVIDHKSFQEALSGLPVARQRQVGARFVEHVLDLAPDPRLRHALEQLDKTGVSAEELQDAWHSVHALYVESHPRSHFAMLDFRVQAMHFVTEACLVCLSPTWPEAKVQRVAEKAAMYCRMARTCANIEHEQEEPDLSATAVALGDETRAQYRIVNEFLAH